MNTIQIETTRFGRIDIAESSLLHFPRGLYGLEQTRSFCLLPHDDAGFFQWLQAAEEPALAMLITDPFAYFNNYEVEIPDPVADLLQVTTSADVTVFVSVTLARNARQLYANLLGPLVINHRAGLGAQIIQDSSRYTTRHLIVERHSDSADEAVTPQSILNGHGAESTDRAAHASLSGGRPGAPRPQVVPV